jgi:hypothetical protein
MGVVKGAQCIHQEAYDMGWDDGFDNGIVSSRKAVINKLENMNPKLSNPEFQLGYDHAVAIVKGDI